MSKKRVAVHGRQDPAKTQLLQLLNSSPSEFEFVTTTPENRFRIVTNGTNPPIQTASLQILLIDLNTSLPPGYTLHGLYRDCNWERPLVVIFHGENAELKRTYEQSLANNHIPIFHLTEIGNLPPNDIYQSLRGFALQTNSEEQTQHIILH